MGAAEKLSIHLHSVADDAASTVRAGRRQGLDGALEAIEDVRSVVDHDSERLLVLIPAGLTSAHTILPFDSAAAGS
jgi:hypothetical protein